MMTCLVIRYLCEKVTKICKMLTLEPSPRIMFLKLTRRSLKWNLISSNYQPMNPSETQKYSEAYLEWCRHPEIQALQPNVENTEEIWIPTSEQLLQLLKQNLPYPERSVFHQTENGWEYETYFREWAADYGTYIDTHRQFVGTDPETVLLQVLMALLGIGERWMV